MMRIPISRWALVGRTSRAAPTSSASWAAASSQVRFKATATPLAAVSSTTTTSSVDVSNNNTGTSSAVAKNSTQRQAALLLENEDKEEIVNEQLQALTKEERKAAKKEKAAADMGQLASDLFETLSPVLKKNLQAMGISSLFPVQAQTLEACRAGKDLVVRSKTGSGKTIAFALPTLEKLMANKSKAVRGTPKAIVLAPTRELALQVHREFEKLAPSLNCVAVYGGASIVTQAQQLRDAVDVVVGTPGRVKDFLDRGTLKLDQVQVAILDEADEMLKVGFYEAIQEIYEAMPSKSERQNLLFSATVSREIRSICDSFLNKPMFVDLVGDTTSKIPDTVEMCVTPVTTDSKEAALSAILAAHSVGSTKENPKRALVFCTTKRECEELSRSFHSADATLSGGALHGDMSQNAREDMLSKFREGSCLVLVATDVAARGLDIPEVDLVVHYSLPRDQDSFVHRSGRTGRAGRKGTNIIFYDPSRDMGDLRDLERSVGLRFAKRAVPCGPEVVRRQAEVVSNNLISSGTILQWFKPVADELRKKDAETGSDSLAAALAMIMGGNTRLKVFSALNGRSGNQTVKIESDETKLDATKVTEFMKTLPAFAKNPKGTLVRDFHRVKNSTAVLADVPEQYVGDMLNHASENGLKIEVVEGLVPESQRDFHDDRNRSGGDRFKPNASSSYGRTSNRGGSAGGYRSGNASGYGRAGSNSSYGRSGNRSSRDGGYSSSRGSWGHQGERDRKRNDY